MDTARQDETAAQDAIAAREGDVEAARAHVAEMEQRRDAQQRDLRDLQGDIDAAQQLSSHETERLHRQELALGRIRADLSQLSDRLWNTYELSYAGAEEALREYDARKAGESAPDGEPLPAPFDENAADEEARRIRDRRAPDGLGQRGRHRGIRADVRALHRSERAAHGPRTRQEGPERADRPAAGAMETVFVRQFSTLQEYFSETFTRLFGRAAGVKSA